MWKELCFFFFVIAVESLLKLFFNKLGLGINSNVLFIAKNLPYFWPLDVASVLNYINLRFLSFVVFVRFLLDVFLSFHWCRSSHTSL